MPRSGKLPVLNLLTGQKSGFFRPAGATRSTDSRQTWQGRRARGSACLCKISPQSAQWVGLRPPKYQKFSLFGKESPRRDEPLDRYCWGFYMPNYPALAFHIWRDSLHRLRSYWRETARRSIRPNFSVHPVGKTMRWIKKCSFEGS